MGRRQLQACPSFGRNERGAVMVLFVIGMVAILGIAGLALDGGHGMLSKSRLQNTVDAAALSAAKTLVETDDTILATAAAMAMFSTNAGGAGNAELARAVADGSVEVTVEFSNTLKPFTVGSFPPEYVRVRAENFALPVWFSVIVGLNDKSVSARAVAGRSPTLGPDDEVCNIMPMMVCGDPDAGPPYYGYDVGQPVVLKSGTSGTPGPGNFQLIRLGDNTGAADIRAAMAGSFNQCLDEDDSNVDTEPGNTVGPVAQGLNTRFGSYLGPMNGTQSQYPPDVVTQQPIPPLDDNDDGQILQNGQVVTDSSQIDFAHAEYDDRVQNEQYDYQPSPNGIGAFGRRSAAVAIGDCSGTTNGQGEVPLLGYGCFFLLQEVQQGGGPDPDIFGEFIEECNAGGNPGPDPDDTDGLFVIQLYRDYGSTDS